MESRLYDEYSQDNFKDDIKKSKNKNLIHEYWICLGLLKSQLCTQVKDDIKCETDIVDDIINTNISFFENTKKNIKVPIVSVDGTCCTGKSTLCSRNVHIKTNYHMSNIGMNTNSASAIGYYFHSLKLMCDFVKLHKKSDKLVLSDRTPWNNILWSLIWKMIVIIKQQQQHDYKYIEESNSYSIMNDICNRRVYTDKILNMWKMIMSIPHSSLMKELVCSTLTVFIVDSNEKGTRDRLKCRGTGSDVERSHWDYYIDVQNYAYALVASKYPDNICIIDINRYADKFDHKTIMKTINDLLVYHFKNFKYENINIKFDHDDSNMFVCDKVSLEGTLYERQRPFKMDGFCTNIKHAYVNYRSEQNYSEVDKK